MVDRSETAVDREELTLIDKRLADLREANEIFRKSSWYRESDIHRNDREIRWLIDLRTVLLADHAQTPALTDALKEVDRLRAGLESIVNCRNPLTRAAVREACAEILAASPSLSSTNRPECPLCPGFSEPCGNTSCPQLRTDSSPEGNGK